MNVYTKFSKAIKGGLGLSFGRSAMDNCDTSCRLWNACYASRIERIYKNLNSKLAWHYGIGAIGVTKLAITQVPKKSVPWFRLSVDGSVPSKKDLTPKQWKLFSASLRKLCGIMADEKNAPIHFPVESVGKARSYRAMLPGVVIRRTSQAKTVAKLVGESDNRSWVVADKIHNGAVRKEEVGRNIDLAQDAAKVIRQSGQSAIVCPEIIGTSKCGKCTACANSKVDVVLYPFHP